VFVRIIEIQGWREPPSAGFFAGSGIRTDGVKARPVGDAGGFDPLKYTVEVGLRHGECIVLEALRTPRGQLNLKLRTGSQHGKGTVDSLRGESLAPAYTDPSVWDRFDPATVTLCSNL
jgi:hypothetical protein